MAFTEIVITTQHTYEDHEPLFSLDGALPMLLYRNHRSEPYGLTSLLEALEVVKPILAGESET